MAELFFRVKPDAQPGSSTDITFETPALSQVPSSDLSDIAGARQEHSQSNGRIAIAMTAQAIRNHLLGRQRLTSQGLQMADVNQDGKIDVADYLTLLNR